MCRRVLFLLAISTSGIQAQELLIERHALTTVELPGSADFLAIDGDFAWVTNEGRVERLEPGFASPTATVKVPEPCGAMIVAFESLWVAECQSKSLVRIDPRTASIVARVSTGLADPSGELSLAAGAGAIWILTDASGQLTQIDPQTNQAVATIPVQVPGTGGDIAVGAGAVWVRATNVLLSVIDPSTRRVVRRYGPPAGSGAVRVANDRVWVTAHDIRKVWTLPTSPQE